MRVGSDHGAPRVRQNIVFVDGITIMLLCINRKNIANLKLTSFYSSLSVYLKCDVVILQLLFSLLDSQVWAYVVYVSLRGAARSSLAFTTPP